MKGHEGKIVKRFSYGQIPGLTSLPSTLTAKKSMKIKVLADRYITIFFGRIQRLQICKIPTDVTGTLNNTGRKMMAL